MGNIAYPIDIPNIESNLGSLATLLGCGLELHFKIGELDFQASREGLSYIPQTIASIKAKLEAVATQLSIHIKDEAEKIENIWERTFFLEKKKEVRLWRAAVEMYIIDSKAPFFNCTNVNYIHAEAPVIKIDDLATRYNISVRAFSKSRSYSTVSNVNSETRRSTNPKTNADGTSVYDAYSVWPFLVERGTAFVITDTKSGSVERAKHHFRNANHPNTLPHTRVVYVLSPVDKTKPMNTKAFFRTLKNPPEEMIMLASSLMEKDRVSTGGNGMAKNVTIMRLEERGNGGYYRSQEMVWRDAGKADSFDANTTHYYLPLSGYLIDSVRFKDWAAKNVVRTINGSNIAGISNKTIFGVRKGDIEFIKTQTNWVNLEDHIADVLTKLTPDDFKKLAAGTVDKYKLLQYNDGIVKAVSNPKSPYVKTATYLKGVRENDVSEISLKELFKLFGVVLDIQPIVEAIVKDSADVYARYPLLKDLGHRCTSSDIAEYINLIDEKKGV